MRRISQMRGLGFGVTSLALSAVIVAPALAVTPITGNVSCTVTGSATLKPGLPLNSPGAATRKFKTKVMFRGTLSGCTGTQNGTKQGLQMEGGSVMAKGTVVTLPGEALPSCAGLATPATTPIQLRSTAKFTNSDGGGPKTIGSSKGVLTLGTPMIGATISFEASGPVLKGAFAGQNLSVLAVLDLTAADFAAACSSPSGLTTLSFTGAQGDSMLVSP